MVAPLDLTGMLEPTGTHPGGEHHAAADPGESGELPKPTQMTSAPSAPLEA